MAMKLLCCCLVAALLTIVSGAAIDVEKTIQQVESILQTNSQLPRLNRDEIIQLLNDIRAEDSKSNSVSKEQSKEINNEIPTNKVSKPFYPTTLSPDIQNNNIDEKDNLVASALPVDEVVETSTKSEPTVMVVLPYTPRDGSSLQELYTKPPRTEVVPESKIASKPITSGEKLLETLKNNAKLAEKNKQELPVDLQAFLTAHGLQGSSDIDHFLLPLEGFKPLPPARIIDDSVELPESLLLAYDLISPSQLKSSTKSDKNTKQDQFYFDPIGAEVPTELDTSASEVRKTVSLPYDLPKKRTAKSTNRHPMHNHDRIDYESVKVIPLQKGPKPAEEIMSILQNEPAKRQAESSDSETTPEPTTTISSESKDVSTDTPSDSVSADSGASISDLEDSFGGPVKSEPGDSQLPPPKKNGFYWMLDWNSFYEVGDGDTKVDIHFEPKLGDPHMFLPVNVP